jgi:hypothetical protein
MWLLLEIGPVSWRGEGSLSLEAQMRLWAGERACRIEKESRYEDIEWDNSFNILERFHNPKDSLGVQS